MKKKIVGAFIVTLMLAGNHHTVAEASTLATQNVVYRVYIDDEVVGLMTDRSGYDAFVEEHKNELAKQYPNHEIKDPTNVRIEEEITLLPVTTINDENVLKTITEKANFKTSTQTVTIDDKSFVVENTDIVNQTLLDLMEYYTSSEHPIESLMESGSQYIGVKVAQTVKVDDTYSLPKDILTAEQARRMLLYGQPEPKETVTFDEDSSLWYIAHDHGMTEDELLLLNPQLKGLKWADLLGQEVDVTPLNPLITVESEQEKVNISKVGYDTEYIDDDTMLKGQTKVQQEGQEGEILTRTHVVYENGELASSEVVEEKQLSEPIKKVVVRGTKVPSPV